MENDQLKGIEKILTEKELIELLGIKRSALDDMRHKKQLPFCKISNTNRIYLVKDVIDFIESRRIVLNKNT
jgi:predicted DNA-binding transcriptional regulator AlpA